MTAELGAQTGLIAPDETTRALPGAAGVGARVDVDALAAATPTRRGTRAPLRRVDARAAGRARRTARRTPRRSTAMPARAIDVAYIGACTGAKLDDLRMAARVLARPHGCAAACRCWSRRHRGATSDGRTRRHAATPRRCRRDAAAERLRHLRRLRQPIPRRRTSCISSTARNFKGRMGTASAQRLSRLALHGGGLRRARPHRRPARGADMSGRCGRAFVFGDDVDTDDARARAST